MTSGTSPVAILARMALPLAVFAILASIPHFGSDYATGVALNVVMWIALVESWSVLCALTGYVSLGHAVFYGLGAYVDRKSVV